MTDPKHAPHEAGINWLEHIHAGTFFVDGSFESSQQDYRDDGTPIPPASLYYIIPVELLDAYIQQQKYPVVLPEDLEKRRLQYTCKCGRTNFIEVLKHLEPRDES